MLTLRHSGLREAAGFVVLLVLALAAVGLGGVGIEVDCDATHCAVASGSLLSGTKRLRFRRDEVDPSIASGIRDVGGVYRGSRSQRVACSNPVVTTRDGAVRHFYPVEVCPLLARVDLVPLRQWVEGTRPRYAAQDWIVGINLGVAVALLLGGAWIVGMLLGAETLTLDPRNGVVVRRGGLVSRARFALPAADIVRTVGIVVPNVAGQPGPLPSGHLYVETRDGRWHLVTRHRALATQAQAYLQAQGVPHAVHPSSEVTRRARGSVGRILLGIAVWTVVFGGAVAVFVGAAFQAAVPALH